ncbi:MAG: NADH-quinone oxidoreductase subunit L [Cyanobacteria bacterium NC_groundwater_1444_Ag_S-0.65um_54_12]|nr:NADH-quinone oxidoreductase subunit L [Cyanobacteria bacterium NC_groundwater_1444_Ag_S-0.65um_54_12]
MPNNATLLLIPALPLLGAACNGAIALWNARYNAAYGPPERSCRARRIPDQSVSWIGVLAPLAAALIAWVIALQMFKLPATERIITFTLGRWFGAGSWQVDWAFLLDPLSLTMVLVITSIGTLIHVYSVGYMANDPGYARYFSYLNLFCAMMLILVMARDLVFMFVGWEGVGLCSYLLIGFWFSDAAKAAAGTKAFVVNRIGDLGLLLGLFLLYWSLKPFDLTSFDVSKLGDSITALSEGTAVAIALLLLVGAIGKSAQFPLHIWLPDAMAGPTPVSALIHAATMVTAGVYLVARLHPIFAAADSALWVVGLVGGGTALLAATVACAQQNIKRVIAWSTISQLGYMFMGLATASYAAGVFHLVTHAFFKGLFFLAAGAVIHALHGEESLARMGGLWPKLRKTGSAFAVAALANAGLVPLSGFVSKDAILAAAWNEQLWLFWLLGWLVAGVTAFYSWRLVLLIFAGKPRDLELQQKAHEPPLVMGIPLVILTGGAVLTGVLNWPTELGGTALFDHFLAPVFASASVVSHHHSGNALLVTALSIAIVLAGLGLAWWRYAGADAPLDAPWPGMKSLWRILAQHWYLDWLYERLITKPALWLAQTAFLQGERLINSSYETLSRGYWQLGQGLRLLQTGMVRIYGYAMLLGLLVLVICAALLGRTSQ